MKMSADKHVGVSLLSHDSNDLLERARRVLFIAQMWILYEKVRIVARSLLTKEQQARPYSNSDANPP